MKALLLLVLFGAVFSSPIPEVTKDEERSYLEDHPNIKAMIDAAIEKDESKKVEKTEMNDEVKKQLASSIPNDNVIVEEKEMKSNDIITEDEVTLEKDQENQLDPEMKDMAQKVADHLMQNPIFKDQIDDIKNEQDAKVKEEKMEKLKDEIHKGMEKFQKKRDEAIQKKQEMKDAAKRIAKKMMDNPEVKKEVMEAFQDPEKREERIASLKDSIRKALNKVKERKDAAKTQDAIKKVDSNNELKVKVEDENVANPAADAVARKVATHLMQNDVFHDKVVAIYKEEDPVQKEKMKKKLKDAIHRAILKVKDEKTVNPAIKDMAHNMAAKLMDNPIIHEQVTEIFTEQDPKVKAEKKQKLKDAIHHALVKVEDEKAEKATNPALEGIAHDMAAKLMENPVIKKTVNDIKVEEVSEAASEKLLRQDARDGAKYSKCTYRLYTCAGYKSWCQIGDAWDSDQSTMTKPNAFSSFARYGGDNCCITICKRPHFQECAKVCESVPDLNMYPGWNNNVESFKIEG